MLKIGFIRMGRHCDSNKHWIIYCGLVFSLPFHGFRGNENVTNARSRVVFKRDKVCMDGSPYYRSVVQSLQKLILKLQTHEFDAVLFVFVGKELPGGIKAFCN